jgi:hypothetical protein
LAKIKFGAVVAVGVCEGPESVAVLVGVLVGVLVEVEVLVAAVAVWVKVDVGEAVGVCEGVTVFVAVLVAVGEGPNVAVLVGMGSPILISHHLPSFSLESWPLSTPRLTI